MIKIKNKAKAVTMDVYSGKEVDFEINFSKIFKDCVRIGNSKYRVIIRYADLFAFMFTIASPEQQAKMIPVREELGNQYMKQIQVKLKNDMKAGEFLVVNVPINVPQIIEDAIIKEKELSTVSPYLTEDKDSS